jgi:protein involved in polysaccharide export with SLBB domain
MIFNKQEADSRQVLLEPLIAELRENLVPGKLAPVVTVSGAVKHPGTYPLLEGDTVQDLIKGAGGLTNASYQMEAELIRQTLTSEKAVTELLPLGLSSQSDLNFKLAPTDQLHIKQLPDLNLEKTVAIDGKVKFPGTYTIRPGETLSQVVNRAGGLTEYAYPEGAVFTRESLREQEQKRLNDAQRRLTRDIALSGPEQPGEQSTVGDDKDTVTQVLDQVAEAQAVGRLVIDLPALLSSKTGRDVRLQAGDSLTVPEISQAVTVIGEVQYATSHLHDSQLSITDYLNRSGGLAFRADENRIYVIRADGSVRVPNRSRWFGQTDPIEPGDTIVVPLDLTQISSLELAKDLSQIIYQIALGASAVNSLSN